MIDSGILIQRDLSKVDCYLLQEHGESSVSVPTTLLIVLANIVRDRGFEATLRALQDS